MGKATVTYTDDIWKYSIFDIDILGFHDWDELDNGRQYYNVKWFYYSMRQYDRMCVEITYDGKYYIYDDDDGCIKSGSLLDIKEFRYELSKKIEGYNKKV